MDVASEDGTMGVSALTSNLTIASESVGPMEDEEAASQMSIPTSPPSDAGEAPSSSTAAPITVVTGVHEESVDQQQAEVLVEGAQAQEGEGATTTTPAGEGEGGGGGGNLQCPPGMDPEAFAALPEEIQQEVIREYQSTSSQADDIAAASGLDPEALAALPESIRAEVLAQEARERRRREEEARPADPSLAQDMDNASFVASLSPDLREEVLLSATDEVLATLPANLVAEAQVLRERAAAREHVGMYVMGRDRAVGVQLGRGGVVAVAPGAVRGGQARASSSNNAVKPGHMRVEKDRLDHLPITKAALRSLLKMLFLATSPRPKSVLNRVILNLCGDGRLRAAILPALVLTLQGDRQGALDALELQPIENSPTSEESKGEAMVVSSDHKEEENTGVAEDKEGEDDFPPRLLLGYAPDQGLAGAAPVSNPSSTSPSIPPQAARQILDLLTFLSQMSTRIKFELLTRPATKSKGEDAMDVDSTSGDTLVERLMDLLSDPLYTRSSANLDSVLQLLDQIVATLSSYEDPEKKRAREEEEAKKKAEEEAKKKSEESSSSNASGGTSSSTATGEDPAPSTPQEQQEAAASGTQEAVPPAATEAPSGGENTTAGNSGSKVDQVLVPGVTVAAARLQVLCSILREEACTENSFQRINKIAQNLSRVKENRLTLLQELLKVAGVLGQLALKELELLRDQLGSLVQDTVNAESGRPASVPASVVTLSSTSSEMKLLRVLQTVSALAEDEPELLSDLLKRLNLDGLWDELSRCLTVVGTLEELNASAQQKQQQSSSSSSSSSDVPATPQGASSSSSTPSAPGRHGGSGSQPSSSDKKPSLSSSSSMAGLLARLLPVIEAFFVVNARDVLLKKTGTEESKPPSLSQGPSLSSQSLLAALASTTTNLEEKEGKESKASSSGGKGRLDRDSSSGTTAPEGVELARVSRFVERHRLLLNALVRQNPSLLEKTLAPLVALQVCRMFLDFDNKKAYFRTQIAKLKKAHSRYRRLPMLQLRVRRNNVFHDSFHQLNLRTPEEMRAKLQIR